MKYKKFKFPKDQSDVFKLFNKTKTQTKPQRLHLPS